MCGSRGEPAPPRRLGLTAVGLRPPRRCHRRGILTRKVITMTAQLGQIDEAGQNGGQGRPLGYARVQAALPQSSLTAIAQHMFSLMLRNMSGHPAMSLPQPVNCAPLHSAFGPGCPYCPGTRDRDRRGAVQPQPSPGAQRALADARGDLQELRGLTSNGTVSGDSGLKAAGLQAQVPAHRHALCQTWRPGSVSNAGRSPAAGRSRPR